MGAAGLQLDHLLPMHLLQKNNGRTDGGLQALSVDLDMGALITHMFAQIHAVPRR
jgi:hypothetical protein